MSFGILPLLEQADKVRLQQAFLVCRHAGVLITTIMIARWLPVEQVAGIEKLLLCGYMFTFFWNDGFLRAFLSVQPADKDRLNFLWIVFAMVALTMLVLFSLSPWLMPALTGDKFLVGVGWFCLYQACILPFWITPFVINLSRFQLVICSLFALIGPVVATLFGYHQLPSSEGVLLGWAGYGITAFLFLIILKAIRPGFANAKYLSKLWTNAWPLILFAISAGVARSFDSWWISRMSSDHEFAVFRYGARDFPWSTALAGGLSLSLIPKLINDDSLPELRLRSTRLLHLIMPPAMILMVWSPFLFKWIYGNVYLNSAIIFNLYLLLTLTQVVFPQSILVARNESRFLWYVSLIELAVNCLISILLFQFFGIYGVAAGTLIAFAFEKTILLIWIKRKFGIKVRSIIDQRLWLRYTIFMVLIFLFTLWYPSVTGI